MTYKKLRELLAKKKVYNSYDLAGKGNVFLCYEPGDRQYASTYAVVRPGFNTDNNAAWYNYGCKTFIASNREEKIIALEKAKAWAGEKYKITDWTKTPFGAWMSKAVLDKRLKEIL